MGTGSGSDLTGEMTRIVGEVKKIGIKYLTGQVFLVYFWAFCLTENAFFGVEDENVYAKGKRNRPEMVRG